jgi:hypothetical protein
MQGQEPLICEVVDKREDAKEEGRRKAGSESTQPDAQKLGSSLNLVDATSGMTYLTE